MERPYPPDPEESGFLEPPRRRPPTAVGVATPPPPRRRSNYRGVRSTTRLVSFGILAASFAGMGSGAFFFLEASGYFIGTASLVVSIGLCVRIGRDLRARRKDAARREGRRAA